MAEKRTEQMVSDLEAADRRHSAEPEPPTLLEQVRLSDVVGLSMDAMQGLITRYRMAGLPPDVLVTVPVGGLLALKLTGTNFSVSSGFGFVALMGVAVQTSVILYSFINKLRLEGKSIATATFEASLLRLRPIMMTAIVACLGLLPAAMSTGIGSDSQKPFAIVIVGGLISRLALSVFLAPVLYALVAKDDDVLKV